MLTQKMIKAEYRRQWCPYFVAHIREKLALGTIRSFGFFFGPSQLLGLLERLLGLFAGRDIANDAQDTLQGAVANLGHKQELADQAVVCAGTDSRLVAR